MFRASMFALIGGLVILVGGSTAQEKKKDDAKVAKDESKSVKEGKAKGQLPQNWGKIGLSDDQKQQIYRVQAKHAVDIDKLSAKIAEHKAARDVEMKAILTADQKKKLEEIVTSKAK